MKPVPHEAVQRFRDIITTRMGLQFGDDRLDQLRDLLRARADENGGVEEYLARLAHARSQGSEMRAIAADLTVSETYFFRNADQFRALQDRALPEAAAEARGRPLRVLSAGCASGEEAYSIAIVVHEIRASRAFPEVEIVGVDVSHRVVQKARRAHYSAWAVRGTPERLRRAYFDAAGRDLVLRPEIAAMVRFEERNLVLDDPEFWRPASFDVVFFRNTFMYFSPEIAHSVIARISGALVPGGFLFIGHAETLRGLSDEHELQQSHETFYYRKRDRRAAFRPKRPAPAPPAAAAPEPTPIAADDAWFHAIGDASARVTVLVDEALASTRAGTVDPDVRPARRPSLASALALLGDERFADALAMIEQGGGTDADALLLRAVLLVNLGHLDEAAEACRAVLRVDPLSAGAHYLLALHARHVGDPAAARKHDEAAIYLDASFAMPHLHLGLLARRGGDVSDARHHLQEAALRLRRENAGRILLFGGGFTRESLLQLCEAELKRVGPGEARHER